MRLRLGPSTTLQPSLAAVNLLVPRHHRQERALVLLLVSQRQCAHGTAVEAGGEGHNLVRGSCVGFVGVDAGPACAGASVHASKLNQPTKHQQEGCGRFQLGEMTSLKAQTRVRLKPP